MPESQGRAELGDSQVDPEGQVEQARLVLRWLAGELDDLPSRIGAGKRDGESSAPLARSRAAAEEACTWAQLVSVQE